MFSIECTVFKKIIYTGSMIRKLFKDYLVYSAIIVKWLYDAFLQFYFIYFVICFK